MQTLFITIITIIIIIIIIMMMMMMMIIIIYLIHLFIAKYSIELYSRYSGSVNSFAFFCSFSIVWSIIK